MKVNSSCPCCSSAMLLHLSKRNSFWLCSHCRAKVPNTDAQVSLNKTTSIKFNSPSKTAIASLQSGQPVAAI